MSLWIQFECLQEFSENRERTLIERGVIAEKQSELPFVETGEAMCNICYCPCDVEKECGWLSCKHQVSTVKHYYHLHFVLFCCSLGL